MNQAYLRTKQGAHATAPTATLRSEARASGALTNNAHQLKGIPATRATSVVVQRIEIEDSLRNVAQYSPNTYATYGKALIERVLRDNHLEVRGHASGGSGDGMNQATKDDIAALIPYLRAAKQAAPAEAAESKQKPDKSKRHDEAQELAAARAKEQAKKDRAAAKKAAYDAQQRH